MRVTVRVTVICSLKNVCFTNSVMEYLSNVRVPVRVTVMCSLKNVCLTNSVMEYCVMCVSLYVSLPYVL